MEEDVIDCRLLILASLSFSLLIVLFVVLPGRERGMKWRKHLDVGDELYELMDQAKFCGAGELQKIVLDSSRNFRRHKNNFELLCL